MVRDVIDWDFEQTSIDSFKVTLELDVDNRMLMQIFNSSREKLKRDKNISVGGSPDLLDSFDVDSRYLNFLKTTLSGKLKNVYADVKSDGIIILNDKADKGSFKRIDANKWRFVFIVTGQFYKKI